MRRALWLLLAWSRVATAQPIEPPRKLDLLVVQDNPRLNMTRAIWKGLMAAIEADIPSVHVGLVSSDFGTSGAPGPTCVDATQGGILLPVPGSGDRFIWDVALPNGVHESNVDTVPTLTLEIANLVDSQPDVACSYSRPLEAMERALGGSQPANVGFLRPEAFLLVVFVTLADDCSALDPGFYQLNDQQVGPERFRCTQQGTVCGDPPRPPLPGADDVVFTDCRPTAAGFLQAPEHYARFLRSLKVDPSMIMVAAFADPSRTLTVGSVAGRPVERAVCTIGASEVFAAPRVVALTSAFLPDALASPCDNGPQFVNLGLAVRRHIESFHPAASADGGQSADAGPAAPAGNGCGCRTAGPTPAGFPTALVVSACAVWACRRRRAG